MGVLDWVAGLTAAGFTAIAVIASAIIAILAYFQSIKGIAKREALTVIRDQIGDKDWLRDDEDWQVLRGTILADKSRDDTLERRLEVYAKASPPKKWKPGPYIFAKRGKRSEQKTDEILIREEFAARRSLIMRRMNRYEMIAIGIRRKSIDEETYRLWWRTSAVKHFLLHRFFIAEARKESIRIFRQYQWLSHRFANEDDRLTIAVALGGSEELNPESRTAMKQILQLMAFWRPVAIIAAILVIILLTLGIEYWLEQRADDRPLAPITDGQAA